MSVTHTSERRDESGNLAVGIEEIVCKKYPLEVLFANDSEPMP